jgi:hypothetical protein
MKLELLFFYFLYSHIRIIKILFFFVENWFIDYDKFLYEEPNFWFKKKQHCSLKLKNEWISKENTFFFF